MKTRLPVPARVLLSCVLALAIGEILCRYRFRRNVEALAITEADLYYFYDLAGVRHHVPNKVGRERMWNGIGTAEFRINAWGFRGPPLDRQKQPGICRVVFLGDSITLGGRLNEPDIFVSRVGQALNREHPVPIEVVNTGVGDIGVAEELDILEHKVLRLSPDLVVLCWFLNDGRPPVAAREETIYRNPVIRWLQRQPILKKSYMAGLAYEAIRDWLLTHNLEGMNRVNVRFAWGPLYQRGTWRADPAAFREMLRLARYEWGDAWNPESRGRMFGMIARMAGKSRAAGARFAVVAFPVEAQVTATVADAIPEFDEPQREMAALCRSLELPFLDLLPALRARSAEPVFYDYCHYTPHGNEVVADLITAFLQEHHLVQP